MTSSAAFDLFANDYDAWFADNRDLLDSEVRLLAFVWPGSSAARCLSVGCGTGLFEAILAREHGIVVGEGVEPSREMAAIARQRGMDVTMSTAEGAELGEDAYDVLLFNGSTTYVADLRDAFRRARAALRPGGHIVVVDVPRESAYGLLYCLASELGTWEHPVFAGVKPAAAYPLELAKAGIWRTTAERMDALAASGFEVVRSAQTLTRNPVHTSEGVEQPREGHDSGSYVAVVARRAA